MNRRAFLRALVAAPIAAAVAPLAVARPAFATGGVISGSTAVFGDYAGETIFPASVSWVANPAWAMKAYLKDIVGIDGLPEAAFEEAAAYCDELVEVDIADASPAAH